MPQASIGLLYLILVTILKEKMQRHWKGSNRGLWERFLGDALPIQGTFRNVGFFEENTEERCDKSIQRDDELDSVPFAGGGSGWEVVGVKYRERESRMTQGKLLYIVRD